VGVAETERDTVKVLELRAHHDSSANNARKLQVEVWSIFDNVASVYVPTDVWLQLDRRTRTVWTDRSATKVCRFGRG
jgi:hypothetical protein